MRNVTFFLIIIIVFFSECTKPDSCITLATDTFDKIKKKKKNNKNYKMQRMEIFVHKCRNWKTGGKLYQTVVIAQQ